MTLEGLAVMAGAVPVRAREPVPTYTVASGGKVQARSQSVSTGAVPIAVPGRVVALV